MVTELGPDEFARVSHLRHEAGLVLPLIRSVVERTQPGRILVDRRDAPEAAMVFAAAGFCCLLGRGDDRKFNTRLESRLREPASKAYLLWYAPPVWWQRALDRLPELIARRRTRLRFAWHAALREPPPALPAGLTVRALDRDLLARTGAFRLDIASRFWPGADAFFASGFGTCVLAGEDVVALCYAAAVAQGRAEIDIATLPGHRNRGLGRIAAHGFVDECLRRGLEPAWDCFDYNDGSLGVARCLGFADPHPYPFYSLNVPLSPDATNE